MSKYQGHSVAVASNIADISTETFQTIKKMDKACRQLSKLLDKKVKALSLSKSVTEEAVHEADLMRKALEALSASKVQLAVKNYDLIDQNIKVVDQEIGLLEKALIENGETFSTDDGSSQYNGAASGKAGAASHKRKLDKASTGSSETNVDPNEPLYCICNRIAFGDMIACDNEDCPIEWFHYPCVNLTRKPRNSWICPTCASNNKKKRH